MLSSRAFAAPESGQKPEVVYFYSSHCYECSYLKDEVFPPIKKKYALRVSWKELNIDEDPRNLDLAVKLIFSERKMGTIAPSVVIGSSVLMGVREIESGLENAIELALVSPSPGSDRNSPEQKSYSFKNTPLPVVLASGLVDGINPCAFAAIAFLISMMAVHAYKKGEIIAVSLSFCAAVFLMYFLIGLGAFNFLYSMKHFYRAASLFRGAIGALCFLLAGLSLYDFWVYKRTGDAGRLILVLPGTIKKHISLAIGNHLRDNRKKNLWAFSLGAFFAGVIVSCMEMICTGQIYLPVMVYLLKATEYKIKALSYILLYNVLFILPLVAVAGLYLFGVNSQAFGNFLKKHAGSIKLALALVFAALGGGILLQK